MNNEQLAFANLTEKPAFLGIPEVEIMTGLRGPTELSIAAKVSILKPLGYPNLPKNSAHRYSLVTVRKFNASEDDQRKVRVALSRFWDKKNGSRRSANLQTKRFNPQ